MILLSQLIILIVFNTLFNVAKISWVCYTYVTDVYGGIMAYRGIVKKIYLPKEVKNGQEVDDLHKTKIGFIVESNGKLFKIEMKLNNSNCKIYKGDKVKISVERKKVAIEVDNE